MPRQNIAKYKLAMSSLMLKNNINLGYPLFISGKCLNQLGGNEIDEKKNIYARWIKKNNCKRIK